MQIASGATLESGANNSSTSFEGVISGDGAFTKQGTGILTFSGLNPNTYTGGTSVQAGTLKLTSGSGLADGSGLSLSSGAIFDLDVSDVIGSIDGQGDVQLASGVILSAGSDNSSTTFEGVISGDGAFTKQGTGTLTFSGANPNTYVGETSVEAGTLKLTGGSGFVDTSPLVIDSGATFDLDKSEGVGSISGAGTIDIDFLHYLSVNDDNVTSSFSGSFAGSGDFEKLGSGTLTLSGSSSSFGSTLLM